MSMRPIAEAASPVADVESFEQSLDNWVRAGRRSEERATAADRIREAMKDKHTCTKPDLA